MLPFDPKKPLFGFSARFPHAKRRIHLFVDERFVYFRPKNAAPDWWGVGTRNVFGFGTSVSAAQKWHELVRVRLHKNSFLRLFYLPDPRQGETRLWQIAWRSGGGYVLPIGSSKEVEPAYFLNEAKLNVSLIRASTAYLLGQFESQWCDPNSDVRAALDCCDLSRDEREWRSIVWIRGERDELERVARAACILEMESGWQQGQSLRLSVWVNNLSVISNSVTLGAEAWHSGWRASSNHRVGRLFSRLQGRSFARVTSPIGARDDWNMAWAHDYPLPPIFRNAFIEIEIVPPTQHERLEAALFLRDWLSENVPDLLPDWFPT